MSQPVKQSLDTFVLKYLACAKENKSGADLMVEYDPNWPSECYLAESEAGEQVPWQPIKRSCSASFEGMESALSLIIHPDVKAFFSGYWSDNLQAKTAQGKLQLLQAWNAEDFERLQQNLVGHILMKRRLKQPETLFFGLTDEDDFILTIENDSGKVMLEQVGLIPQKCLANNLADFIASLEPDFESSFSAG